MKTKCSDIEERLGDILAGALPSADLRAVLEHSDECSRCRHLLEMAQGKIDLLPSSSGQDLTGEILRKTSGLACGRVREHICDFVDGKLPCDDAQMLAVHIENCDSCAGLARILEELKVILPRMAKIDPGALFTRQVLAATNRKGRLEQGKRKVLTEWWNAMMRRPRFAWEAAYTGTLFFALVIANPSLISMAASARLDDVRVETLKAWTTANKELTELSSAATSGAAETAGRLSQKVANNRLQAKDSTTRLWQKGQEWAANIGSLDSTRVRGWGTRIQRMFADLWKRLALDRTFL